MVGVERPPHQAAARGGFRQSRPRHIHRRLSVYLQASDGCPPGVGRHGGQHRHHADAVVSDVDQQDRPPNGLALGRTCVARRIHGAHRHSLRYEPDLAVRRLAGRGRATKRAVLVRSVRRRAGDSTALHPVGLSGPADGARGRRRGRVPAKRTLAPSGPRQPNRTIPPRSTGACCSIGTAARVRRGSERSTCAPTSILPSAMSSPGKERGATAWNRANPASLTCFWPGTGPAMASTRAAWNRPLAAERWRRKRCSRRWRANLRYRRLPPALRPRQEITVPFRQDRSLTVNAA